MEGDQHPDLGVTPGPWLAEWRLRRRNRAGPTNGPSFTCCATRPEGDGETGFEFLDSARRSSNFGVGVSSTLSAWAPLTALRILIFTQYLRSASLLLSGLTSCNPAVGQLECPSRPSIAFSFPTLPRQAVPAGRFRRLHKQRRGGKGLADEGGCPTSMDAVLPQVQSSEFNTTGSIGASPSRLPVGFPRTTDTSRTLALWTSSTECRTSTSQEPHPLLEPWHRVRTDSGRIPSLCPTRACVTASTER